MPAEHRATTVLEVPAAEYWSLRRDRGFDEYCAASDNAHYALHSETEEVDENGDVLVIIESTVTYARESLPAPIQGLLRKDEPFRLWSRLKFWDAKFDRAHPGTFETLPSILADKLVISGDCWCEPRDDARSCFLHTRHSVSCKVFGVGGLIESTILSQVKGSYGSLSAATQEYMATDTYAAFRRGRSSAEDQPHGAPPGPSTLPATGEAALPTTGGGTRGRGTDRARQAEPGSLAEADCARAGASGGVAATEDAGTAAEPVELLDPDAHCMAGGSRWLYNDAAGGYLRASLDLGSLKALPGMNTEVRRSTVLSTLDLVCTQLRQTLSESADGISAMDLASALQAEPPAEQASALATTVVRPTAHAGWLTKRGEVNTAPRRRWFRLEDASLSWYAKPPSSETASNVWSHGRVSLAGAVITKDGEAEEHQEGAAKAGATAAGGGRDSPRMATPRGSGSGGRGAYHNGGSGGGGFPLSVRLARSVKRTSLSARLSHLSVA